VAMMVTVAKGHNLDMRAARWARPTGARDTISRPRSRGAAGHLVRLPAANGWVAECQQVSKRGWRAGPRRRSAWTLRHLYRRGSRRERNGSGPRDAGSALTRDDITRSPKILEVLA